MSIRMWALGSMVMVMCAASGMGGDAAPVAPRPADQKAAPKAPEMAPQPGTLKPDVATTETTPTDSPTAE